MIRRHAPSAALLRLAELQSGVLTPEQMRGHGLGRRAVERLVAEGHWHRVDSGLILTRPGRPDWAALAWAGVLLGGDGARLGAAAALFAADAVEDEPEALEILVGHDRRMTDRDPWAFRRERRGTRVGRSWGSPPRVSVEDALLDAVADLTEDQVVELVISVLQSRRTTADRLQSAMGRRLRLRHRAFLTAMLGDAASGAESELERRYLIDVERAHGLPTGQRQVRVGSTVRDVWYEIYRLVVELDGLRGHEGLGQFRDMARDNRNLVSGNLTLRYGWLDVTGRPCAVAVEVGGLLGNLGWEGPLERCPRCILVPDAELWVS